MAMSGRLGMELQPQQMTEEERTYSKKAIADYKYIRDVIMYGDLYRIISPYNNSGYYSIMYVSKDKKKAVVFAYCFEFQGRALTPQLKLYGLDCKTKYKLKELGVDTPLFWGDNLIFDGQYLVNEGINPKLQRCNDSAVILLESVE